MSPAGPRQGVSASQDTADQSAVGCSITISLEGDRRMPANLATSWRPAEQSALLIAVGRGLHPKKGRVGRSLPRCAEVCGCQETDCKASVNDTELEHEHE